MHRFGLMSRVIHFDDPDTKVFNIFFLVFGIFVFLFASYVYSEFLFSQYIHTNITRNIRILNCRLGLIVPLYGLLFLGILIIPHYWNFFEIGISFIEGYCIYCFYKMLAFRIGSKEEVILLIEVSPYTQPCCQTCQQKTPKCCYNIIEIFLIQFFIFRPFLFLFIALIELSPSHDEYNSILTFLSLLTTISLIFAMIALLRSYNFLSEHTKGLLPAQKVLFIKAIILLMVIQNLVITSQQETGLFAKNGHNQEEENVEKFDSSRRWYAAIGIIETFFFSFLIEKIFIIHDNDEMRESLSAAAREAPSGTYFLYVIDILKLWTVVSLLPSTPLLLDGTESDSENVRQKNRSNLEESSLNGM